VDGEAEAGARGGGERREGDRGDAGGGDGVGSDGDPASPPASEKELAQLRERRLVRRLKRGDEQAFDAIVRLYQQQVLNLVFRMLGSREEAEDVAQDVFVTVFQSASGFRGDSKFSTWLYRVTVNHCKNRLKYLKRRGRNRKRPLDEITEHEMARGSGESQPSYHAAIPRPDDLAAGRQLERLIQAEIARLDEEHRLLIVLRDIQGLSYQEINDVTSLNIGTIKSRLHRARLALKEQLAKHLR
jgi:RNA polymerase sigma-70 factor (ECF subfamily)